MAELRTLGAFHDPVPAEVVLAARSAIAYLRMDAELAELTDSAPADAQMAGLRAVGAPTLLLFEADGFTVEIELFHVSGGRLLGGQLTPPYPGRVVIRHGGGTLEVVADEVGRFLAENIAPGPLSLQCAVGGRTIETDWFLA